MLLFNIYNHEFVAKAFHLLYSVLHYYSLSFQNKCVCQSLVHVFGYLASCGATKQMTDQKEIYFRYKCNLKKTISDIQVIVLLNIS